MGEVAGVTSEATLRSVGLRVSILSTRPDRQELVCMSQFFRWKLFGTTAVAMAMAGEEAAGKEAEEAAGEGEERRSRVRETEVWS